VDLKAYLSEKQALVDSFLESYFKRAIKPPILKESILYSLTAGGKRLRPILALATYEACGKDPKDILPYASALELIHTYSLIHDDLPAMDDDSLRRGKPTNHVVYGEAMAILAGDALLTEAFRLLSEPSKKIRPDALIKVIRDVSESAGLLGMVAGQAQDILSEEEPPDQKTLSFIHTHKTGALITASVRLGAILSGARERRLSLLTRYGKCLGLAFQIVDDILDIKGNPEEMGKPSGSDIKKKKMTYPALYGIKRSEQKALKLIKDAIDSIGGLSHRAEPLRALALYVIERTK